MASYLNSLSSMLTNTTSKVTNLVSGETDGKDPWETVVAKALRTYYTDEQKVPFPTFGTPPDPRDAEAVTAFKHRQLLNPDLVQAQAPQVPPPSNYGGGYNASGSGKMGNLWDKPRPDVGHRAASANSPFERVQASTASSRPQITPRALPSQSTYSSQNTSSNPFSNSGPAPIRSAKDRLKQNAGRSSQPRTASPASNGSLGGSAERTNSNGSGVSGGGNYEDSFMPGVYDRGGRGTEKPFMAATSPWATNEDEFSGGGYGAGGYTAPKPAGGRGPGLPSGPRGRR